MASSAPAAQAAKAATTMIPIVFHTLNDPVRTRLVASFGRPGGNLTGNAGLGPELDRKRIELFKEVVPGLTHVAVLLNPANPMTPPRVTETGETARGLKVEVRVVKASSAGELDRALEAIGKARPGGWCGSTIRPMLDELERLVTAHRRCGELSATVDEPTETGYGWQVACSCGAVFERYVTPEIAHHDLLRSRLLAFPG